MRIEEIRNELKTAQTELEKARTAGIAMSSDATASIAEMRAAMENVERIETRINLLSKQLHDAESVQGEAAKMQIMADEDSIQKGASAFKNAGDFFSAVAKMRSNPDARLVEYAGIKSSANGQNITVAADGGYLVPPEYSSELLKFAKSESVVYPLVKHTPVSVDRFIEPYQVSATRADGATNSNGRNGVIAYWAAEAAQYTKSQMKFGQIDTNLTKLTGLAYATEEMLEDLPALNAIITDGFRDEFAFKIDDAIINGTGTSNMPKGFLASQALVSIAKENSQAAATVNMDNIIKMWNALPAANRANAVWLCNQDVEVQLIKMYMTAATNAIPAFLPAGGLSGKPYNTLLGRPIMPVEQCAAVGTLGDILLVDPTQYRWIDKGGMKAATSIHVRFDYDETAFKFTYRCNGYPLWQNAITAYKGGTSRSPYVGLAARA